MLKIVGKRITALFLILMLAVSVTANAVAAASTQLDAVVADTARYVYEAVNNPQVGSVGGEWAVIGLARSEYDIPEKYYQDYYVNVEAYVKAHNGVLHEKKYTDYSRVILGLTAAGFDPTNVAGYDLTAPLGDFDKTIWQGINGPIWALIALDSANYPIPPNPDAKTKATRDLYIAEILRRQLPDGGFNLTAGGGGEIGENGKADPDITAMALQALAKYQERADVKKATEEALACLSKLQNKKGGYASWGTDNSESVAQVIVALAELGIPLDDSRFVKDGNTLLDNLLTFYKQGKGFLHTADGSGSNQMATEQAFYALVAAQRAAEGKSSLYRITDDTAKTDAPDGGADAGKSGLPGKHPDIRIVPVAEPGKTFDDIGTNANRSAIEALAARGIIDGRTETGFDPDGTMTRAEFAALVVRGLGLHEKPNKVFADVPAQSWYAGYVGAACDYGIIDGVTPDTFNPGGTITREEAAVMTARAAKLCGMDTDLAEVTMRDMLAQFPDYVTAFGWARPSLAFCYQNDILSQDDMEIRPKTEIKRCEAAEMLFRLLNAASLI